MSSVPMLALRTAERTSSSVNWSTLAQPSEDGCHSWYMINCLSNHILANLINRDQRDNPKVVELVELLGRVIDHHEIITVNHHHSLHIQVNHHDLQLLVVPFIHDQARHLGRSCAAPNGN